MKVQTSIGSDTKTFTRKSNWFQKRVVRDHPRRNGHKIPVIRDEDKLSQVSERGFLSKVIRRA